jgi:photosystem II stability/assembly factor-like uncharacterized protein
MTGSVFDVRDFGAVGDGRTDDTASFQRALAAIEALSPVIGADGAFSDTRGTVLFIPFGQYFLTSTLHIRRQMTLKGVSGAGDFAGSHLIFAPDIDGIVIERQHIVITDQNNEIVREYGTAFGDWTVIRDLAVRSNFGFAFSQTPNPSVNEDEPISASGRHINHPPLHGHGVVLNGRARLVNCEIAGFHYDGIHIDTVDDFKNANNFEIHNCRIIDNGRHGIFPCGENSNAGRIFGADCGGNAGWGIYDRSFLGNTYVGCHCDGNGHFAQDVRCLLIDPDIPSITYAGTADGGFYRATDGGRTWTPINRGLSVGGFNAQLSALALDTAGTMYAGTLDGGVLQLDVNHLTFLSKWNPVNSGLTNLTVRALVVTANPTIIYAGTDSGVFTSTDRGQSWAPANVGLGNTNVAALAVDPTTPTTVYAGTAGGVFSSADGGLSWTPANVGLGNTSVAALAVDPSTPTTLYAGSPGGLFKTTDGAQTWSISLTGQDVAAIAIDPTRTTILYAGTAAGLFKSTDGGATWTASNSGLSITLDVQAIAVNPQTPTTVYLGTHPAPGFDAFNNLGGVYRSIDGGATWHGGTPNADPPPNGDPETAARTYYGGAYKTTTRAGNVLLGCYSEADQVNGNELIQGTLVLGGTFGGGFNPITEAGIINQDGLVRLPLRGNAYHPLREVAGDPIHGAVFGAEDNEIILADTSAGFTVVGLPSVLPPALDITGRQLTIKRIDTNPQNPSPHPVLIRAGDGAPIDGLVQDIILSNDPHDTTLIAITLIATRTGWQTIAKLT